MRDCSGSAEPRHDAARGLPRERARLPFRAVNRPGRSGYDPGLQRHHLLPREVLGARPFAALFRALDPRCVGFDDFRRNGLLLPATCEAAVMLALPLHRGPHPVYTAMVMERVGAVERDWSARCGAAAGAARADALFRLALLQRALRRGLLRHHAPVPALNRRDPALQADLFADLDAMADRLWAATDGADQSAAVFAALSTARTLAVATSSSIPTPQTIRPSAVTHST